MTDNVTTMPGNAASQAEPHLTPAGAAQQDDGGGPALPQIPYGAWPSPITAAQVAAGRTAVAHPLVAGGAVWWQQDLPDEGGRTTIMRCGAGGQARMVLPAPWSARTRVHEYGGCSYLPVPAPAGRGDGPGPWFVFANFDDQRLYLAGPEVAEGAGEPAPLTPDPAASGSAASPRRKTRAAPPRRPRRSARGRCGTPTSPSPPTGGRSGASASATSGGRSAGPSSPSRWTARRRRIRRRCGCW